MVTINNLSLDEVALNDTVLRSLITDSLNSYEIAFEKYQ